MDTGISRYNNPGKGYRGINQPRSRKRTGRRCNRMSLAGKGFGGRHTKCMHLFMCTSLHVAIPSINQFIHPSAATGVPISIHPPSSSRQFWPDLHRFAFVNCSQCRIKPVKVSKKVADFFYFFEWGREDGEVSSVRSHWGQMMADTFTKAYSPEEQSTSPVAADYSIITSIGLTASISSTHYSKFMATRNVQNSGGGGGGLMKS